MKKLLIGAVVVATLSLGACSNPTKSEIAYANVVAEASAQHAKAKKMGFVWKPAKLVKKKITEALEKGVEYKKLREELDKIREEARKLGERLELLEKKSI